MTNAIAQNCACEFGLMGVRLKTCAPHDALVHNQQWVDHLLYLRRTRADCDYSEWPGMTPPEDYP